MREIVKLYVDDKLPHCLHVHLNRTMYFVTLVKSRFKNPTDEKLLDFAESLLLSFYCVHGSIDRVGDDVENLINSL